MIKVIASDMDGTLLGNDHKPAPETLAAVKEACSAGIRFMICTGRNFPGAMNELEGADLICDYIVGSGAEVRNPGRGRKDDPCQHPAVQGDLRGGQQIPDLDHILYGRG